MNPPAFEKELSVQYQIPTFKTLAIGSVGKHESSQLMKLERGEKNREFSLLASDLSSLYGIHLNLSISKYI